MAPIIVLVGGLLIAWAVAGMFFGFSVEVVGAATIGGVVGFAATLSAQAAR